MESNEYISLNNLKEKVDEFINEGHGHRRVLIWQQPDNEYTEMEYTLSLPEEFDRALSGTEINVNKDILLG